MNTTTRDYKEATNDPAVVPPKMLADLREFFDTSEVGKAVPFAGGTITRLDTHGASIGEHVGKYVDPEGVEVSLTYYSDLCAKARENKYLAKQWLDQYGFNPDAAEGANPGTTTA